MAVSRAALVGGPAHITYNSATAHLRDDSVVTLEKTTADQNTSMFGAIDEFTTDAQIKASGSIVEYQDLDVWFPYLDMAIGELIQGASDLPLVYLGRNGDTYTIHNAAITKMPSLYLGVDKPILGAMEWTGLVKNNSDLSDANSLFTIATGGTYVAAAFDKSLDKQQRYTAAISGLTGFTSFQAQEGWTVDFELALEPVKSQSVTVAHKFMGLKVMAKCMPQGPTAAQIEAAFKIQGTGAGAGHLIGGTIGQDLVITGSGVVVTVKTPAIKSAGFVFGGKPLRNGEIGFVSTIDVADGNRGVAAIVAAS